MDLAPCLPSRPQRSYLRVARFLAHDVAGGKLFSQQIIRNAMSRSIHVTRQSIARADDSATPAGNGGRRCSTTSKRAMLISAE